MTAGPTGASGPSLGHARKVQDLIVHRKARSLARGLFLASRAFPFEESSELADPLRRSSPFIGAQVAKARAKRKHPRHFVRKSTDADGGQLATPHRLTTVFDRGYWSSEESGRLGKVCVEIGQTRGLNFSKDDPFCQPGPDRLHEPTSGYRVGAAAHLTD